MDLFHNFRSSKPITPRSFLKILVTTQAIYPTDDNGETFLNSSFAKLYISPNSNFTESNFKILLKFSCIYHKWA